MQLHHRMDQGWFFNDTRLSVMFCSRSPASDWIRPPSSDLFPKQPCISIQACVRVGCVCVGAPLCTGTLLAWVSLPSGLKPCCYSPHKCWQLERACCCITGHCWAVGPCCNTSEEAGSSTGQPLCVAFGPQLTKL